MHGPAGYALGFTAAVFAGLLAVAAGATNHPILSLIAMVAVVDLIAMLSTVPAMLATAIVCWLLHAGFVLGRRGDLVFDDDSRDFGLTLLAAGLCSAAVATALRGSRRPTRTAVPRQRTAEPDLPSRAVVLAPTVERSPR
ncbi:hypothetical protein DFJ66_2478 [Saccharothrix variisporea]|uniref:Uncharacterized protein n=1 Tax=Saccharothrix variisporea TaxID=543527 RepID=A0A495X8S8_9PSEU|nr:hypothetical protein DFJ66_2478 [Saccharothrix variisporea]